MKRWHVAGPKRSAISKAVLKAEKDLLDWSTWTALPDAWVNCSVDVEGLTPWYGSNLSEAVNRNVNSGRAMLEEMDTICINLLA